MTEAVMRCLRSRICSRALISRKLLALGLFESVAADEPAVVGVVWISAKNPGHRFLPVPLIALIGIDSSLVKTEQQSAFVLHRGPELRIGANQWRIGPQLHDLRQ